VANRGHFQGSRLNLVRVFLDGTRFWQQTPLTSRSNMKVRAVFRPFLAFLLLTVLSAAPSVGAGPPPPSDGAIEGLKPGEFLWAPAVAPDGPVTIIVSLKTQRAYAYRNGVPIGVSTVSTGKPGHPTPTGIFTILQKAVDHKSNLYSDASMPFMQRLTWDGIALHAGKLPGYPASHGCVRFPLAFAKLLYAITRLGLTVVITDDAIVPEVAPTPTVLEQEPAPDGRSPSAYKWRPELSPDGPVSIVVSGRDQKLIVLRNGIEIGSSKIGIDGAVTETAAFTLRAVDTEGFHWLRISLPRQTPGLAPDMTRGERARAHLPEAFRAALDGILKPGATLLVTRDTLRSSGTGTRLTVIATEAR